MAEVINACGKVDYLEGQLILREAYDHSYQIFNHPLQFQQDQVAKDKALTRPLSLVAHVYAEDTAAALPLIDVIDEFNRLKIHQHTGLNLAEFLDLPREYTEAIRVSAERAMRKLEAALDKQLAEDKKLQSQHREK